MSLFYYATPLGSIGLEENNDKLIRVYLNRADKPGKDSEVRETPLLREAYKQLDRYCAGKLKSFSLPLEPAGTLFMQQVWQVLRQIPFGQTLTYKEAAQKIGRPLAARAVGMACNRNPIPIIIPCHRIIGTNGSLTGYRGGLDLKKQLLSLERAFVTGEQHG